MPSILTFSGISETGPVREDNQDSILVPESIAPDEIIPQTGDPQGPSIAEGALFALADGMGGYEAGGLASTLAIQALHDTFYYHPNGHPAGTLKRGVEAANLAVCNEANRKNITRMGTTILAGTVSGGQLHLVHVGDSRAYLVRGGSATCLTQDHTVVGDLLRMKVITPAQVRGHARRSILTRALGLTLFVQPDVLSIDLRPGDRVILCSDGLWAVVEDEEIARMGASTASITELCRGLADLALANGTDDNLSVVAVDVHDLDQRPKTGKISGGWLNRMFSRHARGKQGML